MAISALVLGGTGMLGSSLVRHLDRAGVPFLATARDPLGASREVRDRHIAFDATTDDPGAVLDRVEHGGVVVNCIGVIRHLIDDSSARDRRNTIAINSSFPYAVVEAAKQRGLRVIQIATDCVYSGRDGAYDENAPHDAVDIYGQSKSLGEVPDESMLNLRCSIIGPELSTTTSLLEWVLSHPEGSVFNGFTNHLWNGVTTDAFSRIVLGLIGDDPGLNGTYHVVPADAVTKDRLSRDILTAFGRQGVTVEPVETPRGVDRTLATVHPDVNERLWSAAGYDEIPTVQSMIEQLAERVQHPTNEASA